MLAVVVPIAWAQESPASEPSSPTTVLPHPDDTPWWISGQLNLIGQAHGPFTSPYAGDHSLRASRERALSRVWTVYTGLRLSTRTEVFVDVEAAGGGGLSDALGLAGFTDLDVVRNPTLGATPYLARAMIRQIVPLSDDEVPVERGPMGLAMHLPSRRLEIRAGKMGLVDFFDLNGPGSDSHLQFTNWTIDNNGAYDYAADTRGYTFAIVAALITPGWTLQIAEALMPKVANGLDLDWDLGRARGENIEFQFHPDARVTSRTLVYLNHANMGRYDDAIAAYRAGRTPVPDIEAARRQGRRKYGVGENVEYAITHDVRLFGRTGWNEGQNESFAYTEVNNTWEIGGDVAGASWSRPGDRVGVAAVSNGLSSPHREYLRLGGLGFLLGDGQLRYARETIVESYYTAHVWRGVSGSAGVQYLVNPGYNADRGPVLVGTLRLHVDF
jgi:hypothetical protein